MKIMALIAMLLSVGAALPAAEVSDGAVNVTSNAVNVPMNRFFLIRHGSKAALAACRT